MTRDTIDALPTPRNTQSIGYLAQGVRLTRPDVGGAQMMEQVRMTANGANARHTPPCRWTAWSSTRRWPTA